MRYVHVYSVGKQNALETVSMDEPVLLNNPNPEWYLHVPLSNLTAN